MIQLFCKVLLTLASVLLAAWLGAMTYRLLLEPAVLPSTPGRGWTPETGQLTVPTFDIAPLIQLQQTTARPVFFEGRKIPVDAPVLLPTLPTAPAPPSILTAPVAPVAVAFPATMKLLGTVDHDGRIRAMIGDPTSSNWFQLGDTVAGWVIHDISADQVTLKRNGHSATIEIYARPRSD
jgi:hypothetical protein